MSKITLSFKAFDVPNCIKELNIDRNARTDASYGTPDTDAQVFSSTEIAIQHKVSQHYSDGMLHCDKSLLEESLQNAASLRQADGHEGQISSLKISLITLYAATKAKLSTYYSKYRRDRDHLEFFKKDNNLVTGAVLRSTQQKFWSIFIVFGMFLFEVSVNTSLMSGAVSGGVFGALALAGVIAFLNIASSFMVGRLVVPNLYHVKKSKVRLGWLGLCFYVPLIIYINFALGVFRTLSERATQAFNREELQNVALESAWPFDNLATNTLDSNGLIIIGIVFAIIAIIDGLYFDEVYPGYAKVSKTAAESEEEFNSLKAEGFELLYSKQNLGNKQITEFKNVRENANKTWANNIDSVQAAFVDYEDWVVGLSKAGNNLLQHYRSSNKSYRSSPAPAYFSDPFDFSFETDATRRFHSLSAVNISDKEKDEKFSSANQIIIGEYNQAIVELNRIYQEIIDEYQLYLKDLK